MSLFVELPTREGEPPEIGKQPPQLQYSDQGPENIRLALKEWAFGTFPNVIEHDTLISVPTTRALWLNEEVQVAHHDAFMPPKGSREFCHLHLDGSIHTVVDVQLENEIINKVKGINRVVYDISSKPPATIEWE